MWLQVSFTIAEQCCSNSSLLTCAGVQDEVLLAYQIAFDLVENELQSFILKVSWTPQGVGWTELWVRGTLVVIVQPTLEPVLDRGCRCCSAH